MYIVQAYQKLYTCLHDAGGAKSTEDAILAHEYHGISHHQHVSNWGSHLSLFVFEM